MKKITTLITILLLCALSLFAQAPEKFSYQAVVRNANNSLVNNAQVGVRVNILQGTATGDAVYSESHVVSSNANGLITINIGGGSVLHGNFESINWADGPFFLKTDIDPNGGNDYTITSTQQLLSVPYALYSKEAGNVFSGDYNDLTNLPQIPQVPTDVSAFNNDAGYITMDSVPAIPANVSAFTNDAGYLTGYTETDPQFNAWDKDYNDLINLPQIPQVPTDVSAFNNDAGYITMDSVPTIPTNVSTFTNDAGYLTDYTETDPQFNAWDKDYNDLINLPQIPQIPADVSAFNNDAGYITMDSVPAIPTNVSTFTNDAGYLTDYTETDPQFNAWDKDYNDLINLPQIPQVPTDVSAFNNDAGYITMDSVPAIPTNVSAFTNDAGYLTGYTETDPQFNAWDKDYNDLINLPQIPEVPTDVSAFNNDAGYITSTDIPEIPTVPENVSAFNNDAGYLTEEMQTLADVAAQGNSAGNRQLKDVSDPTDSYDAVNLRTLNQLMDSVRAQLQQMQHQIDSLKDVINTLNPNNDTFVCGVSQITDHEGNVYNTVQIGNQCWTKENLRTTTSPSTGTYLIPPAGTGYTYTGKQAFWYNNDSATYAPMNYGLLYNWNAAVDTFNTAYGETSVNTDDNNNVSVTFTGHRRGICPVGWHLPSDAEWTAMTDYVSSQSEYVCGGDTSYIAKALADSVGWRSSTNTCVVGNNQSANNATGFSAVPAGDCYGSSFYNAGYGAYFWSATQYASYPSYAYYRFLLDTRAYVLRSNLYKGYGFSVRCLRDNDVTPTSQVQPTVTTSAATDITSTTATLNGNVSNPDNVAITAQGFEWKATVNSTYIQVTVSDTTMTYNLTGLTANTSYTYRAFVTTSEGTSYGAEVSFTTEESGIPAGDGQPCPGTPKVTDHEGNTYSTVQIGDQCWMRENLRTTTSPSTGTYLIPAAGTGSTYTGKQARWYNNDSATYAPMNYGLLYNWNAAMDTFNTVYGETSVNTDFSNAVSVTFNGHRRGICPVGWHLPSDAEWTAMTDYVSSQSEYACGENTSYIAKALADSVGWNSYTSNCAVGNNQSANNATGFSAVPAGHCYGSSFHLAGNIANFWSATQGAGDLYYAYGRHLYYEDADVRGSYGYKYTGVSVRCLRDNDVTPTSQVQPTVTTSVATDITSTTATLNGNVSNPDNVAITAQGFEWKATVNSTYIQVIVSDTTMTYNLTGLTANTSYTYRAFVTTSEGTSYGAEVSFTTEESGIPAGDGQPCLGTPTVTDHEGNVYNTVKIGNQCWTKENLRTTTSPSTGTYLIPAASANYTYTGKQARWYNNNPATYAPMNYGLLYNWNAAVDTFNTLYGETSENTDYSNAVSVTFNGHRRGICPVGWHLPSDAEWTAMAAYVSSQSEYVCGGNTSYIAKVLADSVGWNSSTNTCAVGNDQTSNNASGFGAVPAGYCNDSSFGSAGNGALFWSATQYSGYGAYYRSLGYLNASVYRSGDDKNIGYSVRCLRD